tara:strand:- start:100498 stop:101868 length:1371 start_codon:yes stop_codon:yes gene_type:complete
MTDDKKGRGRDSNKDQKQPRRVVTHHGKKKDLELPEEIKPKKQGNVLDDPIDLGVNPAKHLKKSSKHAEAQANKSQATPEGHAQTKTAPEAKAPPHSASQPPPPSSSNMPTQLPPQSSGYWFISFAFLLSLAALGIVAVVSFVLYQTQQEVQVLKKDMAAEQSTINSLVGKAELALNEVKTLQEKNNASQSELADLKNEIENAQIKFIALTGKKDWVLNEVEYLVHNASQQILINHDVMTALSQLETASKKVKNLGDPALGSLRAALSQDIVKLKSVETLDKEGLWSQLNAIVNALPNLRFKTLLDEPAVDEDSAQVKSTDAEKAQWQKALDKSWDEIKNLIRVSRYDQDQIQPVLAQHEKIQLLRAMQYMVEQAKWAVLKQDNLVYQEALSSLSENMQLFFEQDNVQENLLAEVKKASDINVSVAQPSIMHSLQAVGDALSVSMRDPALSVENNG